MRAYCHAAHMHPSSAAPYVGMARLQHHLGNEADAVRAVERALALSPRDADALEARAALLLGSGDMEGALQHLNGALRVRSAPEVRAHSGGRL